MNYLKVLAIGVMQSELVINDKRRNEGAGYFRMMLAF